MSTPPAAAAQTSADNDNLDETAATAAAAAAGITANSPPAKSSKSIMDIVNRFNSPFRFQSPAAASKKRGRRTLMQGSPQQADNNGDDSYSTPPTKRQRRRCLDDSFAGFDPNEYSNSTAANSNSSVFQRNNNNSNQEATSWSNMSDASASNWREAPITSMTDSTSNNAKSSTEQMEILDWSLPHRLKMELHVPAADGHDNSLMKMKMLFGGSTALDALAYWEFCASTQVEETWTSNVASAASTNKSIDMVKFGRRASVGAATGASRGPFLEGGLLSRQASMPLPATNANSVMMRGKKIGSATNMGSSSSKHMNSDKELAKKLIQSVRGPMAMFSQKRMMEELDRGGGFVNNEAGMMRQWQDALRSLFQNFRNKLVEACHESTTTVVLQNYFYCIAKDHIALFRVMQEGDSLVPAVLVTRTSESFREQLRNHGVVSVDVLEIPDKPQTRENSMAASNRRLFPAKDEKANNPLLSPSVNADLEALRRAQAFGESAGADVYVKVKKQKENKVQPRQQLFQPMKVTGWDDVSTFLEVYLNSYGREANTPSALGESSPSLPNLLCSHDMGPFDHASLRRARMLPVPSETTAESTGDAQVQDQTAAVSFEVCGMILPCTMRKLLVAGRNLLLEDESSVMMASHNEPTPENASPTHDSSRYIVLHSVRPLQPTKSKLQTMDVTNESIVFNQGPVGETEDCVFECPAGKLLSMLVWDTSRAEVAACKLEGAE
ncbi:MAG: hypothetical protein SGILL_003718 [Bacillariaceae sp.]